MQESKPKKPAEVMARSHGLLPLTSLQTLKFASLPKLSHFSPYLTLDFGNKYLLMKALTIITITIASATILLAGEEGYYAQFQSDALQKDI